MIPADIIKQPKWSYEKKARRTVDSKTFRVGRNKYKLIQVKGIVHYKDNVDDETENWKEINLIPKNRGLFSTRRFEINKAPYNLTIMKNEIGFTYTSKKGGTVKVKLSKIGMVDVNGNINISPRVEDNKIWWDNVVSDLDIYLEFKSASLQFFKVLKTNNAPKEFEWEVEEDEQHSLKVNNKHLGWDEDKAQVKLNKEIKNERIENNKKKYILREVIENKTAEKSKKTRVKNWTDKIKYPLLIDIPDITEDIVADVDDGRSAYYGPGSSYFYFTQVSLQVAGSTGGFGGFRYRGVNVPQGATIDLAVIKIETGSDGGWAGYVYGNDADTAALWNGGGGSGDVIEMPRDMAKTTAKTSFNPAGSTVNTVTITDIVKEIVDRTGWSSGNNMKFIMKGTNANPIVVFLYASSPGNQPAVLEIDFTAGAGPTGRRRLITSTSGFMKIRNILIGTGVIIALVASFLGGNQLKKPEACNQFVWNGTEEVCIPDNLLEYVKTLESGAVNRLKSKRGIINK